MRKKKVPLLLKVMNKQYLKDTLAFIRHIHLSDRTDKDKYAAILMTLAHDLNGLINNERCFSPRVTGYSKLEKN